MIMLCICFVNIKSCAMLIYAICGFIFIFQLALIIKKYLGKLFEMLSYVGQRTLPILCLHLLCFKVVTLLYIFVTKSNKSLLETFPAIQSMNHPIILSILYTLIGILLPLFFYNYYSAMTEKIRRV